MAFEQDKAAALTDETSDELFEAVEYLHLYRVDNNLQNMFKDLMTQRTQGCTVIQLVLKRI